MKKVVFISPTHPVEMMDFTRALSEEGAAVMGVGEQPESALPRGVRPYLDAYLQVPRLLDEASASAAIVRAVERLGVDHVESLWEVTVQLAARVRETLGIPGMSRDTVLGFRDKELMKARLRAANLPVPRSQRVMTAQAALQAAEDIGYPVIIKPIDGAGSADTYHCRSEKQLQLALGRMGHITQASLEEYVDGDEFTYDTVCIDGKPVFENVAQYFPRPLIARSESWISPAQIVYRDPFRPDLMAGVELGRSVLTALGMGTGFTHMEWYRRADGSAVFGEIGCRSGGGHFVDMMNWSNDFDVYRGWAQAVLSGTFDVVPQRKYHVAMVFKRAQGEGHISHIEGVQNLYERFGEAIVANGLLPVGAHRRDWKQTLVSDGCLVVRHPELEDCREMMDAIIRDVHLYAE